MLDDWQRSQITGGAENAGLPFVDIPVPGGRRSDLLFEAILKEYFLFIYEYPVFFQFFRSGLLL
jgi:hypothetical protein